MALRAAALPSSLSFTPTALARDFATLLWPHLLQGLADFRLEQDNHDDNARREKRPQDGVEHEQIKPGWR